MRDLDYIAGICAVLALVIGMSWGYKLAQPVPVRAAFSVTCSNTSEPSGTDANIGWVSGMTWGTPSTGTIDTNTAIEARIDSTVSGTFNDPGAAQPLPQEPKRRHFIRGGK